jgi:signal transduction histidine kinase
MVADTARRGGDAMAAPPCSMRADQTVPRRPRGAVSLKPGGPRVDDGNALMDMANDTCRRAEVEYANDQRDALLGLAAHDLRNPLHRLRACTELLMADAHDALTPDQRELLMIIRARTRRLLEHVDGVLDGIALQRSRLALAVAPVALVPFVRHVVRLSAPMASAKGITLEMTAEGAASVLIDAERLEQALDTVIGDAIDRTRRGGRVAVRVERTAEHAVVSVRDDGAAPSPGGLEPAIVERIVRGHDGVVDARCDGARGWHWQLELPLVEGNN